MVLFIDLSYDIMMVKVFMIHEKGQGLQRSFSMRVLGGLSFRAHELREGMRGVDVHQNVHNRVSSFEDTNKSLDVWMKGKKVVWWWFIRVVIAFLAIEMRLGTGFCRNVYKISIRRFQTSTTSLNVVDLLSQTESRFSNSRFWLKTFDLKLNPSQAHLNNRSQKAIEDVIEQVKDTINLGKVELSMSENGVVIIPSRQLIIPLHRNIVQTQHAVVDETLTSNTTDVEEKNGLVKMIICGFAPRAAHVTKTEEERQRPIDPERVKAMTIALNKVTDVTGEDLMGERYVGTAPAKMYRSFIAPRAKADYSTFVSIDKAADRIALQIEQGLRQLRADEAAYLVNTDRSIGIFNTSNNASLENPQPERKLHPITLVLDNIRSAQNVGCMFRTAETASINEIITCGITAHPPHPKLRKTAFSAVDVVPSRHFLDVISAIKQLKEEGNTILVMETTKKSINYVDVNAKQFSKMAIVVGNEITGVDPRIMEIADSIVEIPTYGIKNSLNVASAASIMIFELLRQMNSK